MVDVREHPIERLKKTAKILSGQQETARTQKRQIVIHKATSITLHKNKNRQPIDKQQKRHTAINGLRCSRQRAISNNKISKKALLLFADIAFYDTVSNSYYSAGTVCYIVFMRYKHYRVSIGVDLTKQIHDF